MLILLALLILTAVGLLILRHDDMSAVGFFSAMLGGTLLIVALVMLPLSRMGTHAKVAEYRSVQETLATARADSDSIENAAFQLKVAELNQWRANVTYWRTTPFALWIPAAVDELEPIR